MCFDWPAIQCIVIGEYRKRVTEMLRPLPYCDAVSWRDDTKTIKPIINEAIAASNGDIITDYKDLYRNDKQQALLYTSQNLRLNRQWQIL